MTKRDKNPSLAEAEGGDGEVVAGEFFNAKQAVSGEYLYRAVTGDPDEVVGTNTTITLTDSGLTVYIKSTSTVWQKGQWRKVTFEGTYYPNLGS